MGLYSRFAAACLAEHPCLLIQDDDVELPPESLRRLYEFWRSDPAVLHGIFGRAAKPDGSYAVHVDEDGEAPIVLTRALLAHRRYASAFFAVAPRFEAIQRGSRPRGNGEDIIFSYVAMRGAGRLNQVHRLPVTELPDPDSIHMRHWDRHLAHRTRLLKACELWIKPSRPPSKREKDADERS